MSHNSETNFKAVQFINIDPRTKVDIPYYYFDQLPSQQTIGKYQSDIAQWSPGVGMAQTVILKEENYQTDFVCKIYTLFKSAPLSINSWAMLA